MTIPVCPNRSNNFKTKQNENFTSNRAIVRIFLRNIVNLRKSQHNQLYGCELKYKAMIDQYTLEKLKAKTHSDLNHHSQIMDLCMLLKARDEKERKSLSEFDKVEPNYHPFEINISTLLRMFGLKEKNYVAKKENLDKLARFLGYPSHRAILREARSKMRQYDDNNFSGCDDERILYSVCLQIGTKISFKYREGREITMVYNGDNLFKVIRTVVSQMKPDNMYEIMVIREGLPLACIEHKNGATYVCGKQGGIFDIRVNDKTLTDYVKTL